MSEEQFEIRIICENSISHPGKSAHITAVTWMERGTWREPGGWCTSLQELEREYTPEGPHRTGRHRTHSIQLEPIPGATGVTTHYGRKRYELRCPRCKFRVAAREETLAPIFDYLRARGRHEVSLQQIMAAINPEASRA